MGLAAVLLAAALYAALAMGGTAHSSAPSTAPSTTAPTDRGAQLPVQAQASAHSCNRYGSETDTAAREVVRSALVAAETIATEDNGFYTHVSPRTIHATTPSIPVTLHQALQSHEDAYLLSASGTESSFIVTARAFDGDLYSMGSSEGATVNQAVECGKETHW
jgi:hypothetical protein